MHPAARSIRDGATAQTSKAIQTAAPMNGKRSDNSLNLGVDDDVHDDRRDQDRGDDEHPHTVDADGRRAVPDDR